MSFWHCAQHCIDDVLHILISDESTSPRLEPRKCKHFVDKPTNRKLRTTAGEDATVIKHKFQVLPWQCPEQVCTPTWRIWGSRFSLGSTGVKQTRELCWPWWNDGSCTNAGSSLLHRQTSKLHKISHCHMLWLKESIKM